MLQLQISLFAKSCKMGRPLNSPASGVALSLFCGRSGLEFNGLFSSNEHTASAAVLFEGVLHTSKWAA